MTKKRSKTHSIGGERGSTCGELLALLNEYVEGGVDPSVCKKLEGHLANCNPCRVVVDNIRNTVTLFRSEEPGELTVAFRDRMHTAIRDCWHAHGPKAKR